MTKNSVTRFVVNNGFLIVLVAIFVLFSVATDHFFQVENVLNILHTMAPLAVTAAGLAVVVISGRLDISVGSTAFLSAAVGALLMKNYGLDPWLAGVLVVACGAVLGAVNGLVVVGLKVNSLIATLGSMIAFRGLALAVSDALLIQIPEEIRVLGNARIMGIPADILIMLIVLVLVHVLHQRTNFGRQITAIGNDEATARKVGLPVDRTGFLSFVLAGVLASIGGILTTVQNGAVSPFLGSGLEFTALAVVVVGGISLMGGRGTILLSIVAGAFIFEMIRNGLTNLGASPYSYRLVGGVVIFAAMYADALKNNLQGLLKKADS
jgi:ribose/xylose/arabinose/galactoside ABC-type transport system permease subunit